VSRLVRLLSLVRLRSFDTSTEEGRSHERYRRAGFTSVVAFSAKAVGVATMLVSVPLALNYLGADSYGLWLTLSSFALMLGFADLGIGNGVLNAVSGAHGRDDRRSARAAVSSGFFMLCAVGGALLAIFAVIYPFVPWERVYNVTSADAVNDAGPTTIVFVIVWALSIPVGLVERVQLGYQRGYVNYAWQAAGSVFALAGLILAIEANAGTPWLVLALAGGPLLAGLLNGVVEFGWVRPWLRPAWSHAARPVVRRLISVGLMFFILQATMVTTYFSDNLIVAQVLGSAAVPQYAVPAKLFGFIVTVISMLVWSLWPAYGEAMTRGDFAWVRRTVVRTLVLTLVLTTGPALLLVLVGRPLIQLWVGDSVEPSLWLLAGLAAWAVVSGVGGAVAIFLNGAGILRFQVVCGILMFAAALPLKIVFARTWGVAGVPWAAVLAYGAFVGIPMAVYVPRLLRRLSSGSMAGPPRS
jgi:O-antigen/teichoic acid export membrane protein